MAYHANYNRSQACLPVSRSVPLKSCCLCQIWQCLIFLQDYASYHSNLERRSLIRRQILIHESIWGIHNIDQHLFGGVQPASGFLPWEEGEDDGKKGAWEMVEKGVMDGTWGDDWEMG